jgi:hypothetical protein
VGFAGVGGAGVGVCAGGVFDLLRRLFRGRVAALISMCDWRKKTY